MAKNIKPLILIVDDQEINRAILADLFCETYNVLEASNGVEALEVIKEKKDKISLIILDIVMPVMDGFTLLEKLNQENMIDIIPIIMITAENSDASAVKGYELGVFDFITKPFKPEIVLHRVKIIRELYDHRRNLENLLKQETNIITQQARKLEQTNSFVIDALSTIVEFRHCESGNHVRRLRNIVSFMLFEIKKSFPEYGLTNEKINMISEASAMHDLGKISIPDAVLLKPGKLTAEEFDLMKKHTTFGCDILESLNYDRNDEFFSTCYDIVRHHHERYDGRGYPDGLVGDEITLPSQVVALADVYDALTTNRVYKPAYTHEEAVKMILKGECGVFNPDIMAIFKKAADRLAREISRSNKNGKVRILPTEKLASTPKRRTEDILSKRTLHLIENERYKQQLISNLTGEIIFDYDYLSDLLTVSEKGHAVLPMDVEIQDFLKNFASFDIFSKRDGERLISLIRNLTPDRPTSSFECQLTQRDGEEKWYEIQMCLIFDLDIRTNIIGRLVNIDEMKKKYENLKEMADIDVLTGLYNRRAFIELFKEKIVKENRNGYFVLIDLDNFKKINDTYGHLVGDAVLTQIAQDMKVKVRDGDVLSRFGGDEFAIYFTDISREDLSNVLESLLQCDCKINNQHEVLTKSIGIASFPRDGKDYEQLLNKADIAMYYTKDKEKAHYIFYEDIR